MRKRGSVVGLCATLFLCTLAMGSSAKTTVAIWGTGQFSNTIDALHKQFTTEHPDLEVVFQPVGNQNAVIEKTTTAIGGGVAPDIVILSVEVASPFLAQNLLSSMTALAAREHYSFSDYFPNLLQGGMWKGQLYMLPFALGYHGSVFYNEDLAQEAGVSLAKSPPHDWNSLTNLAKKFVKRNSEGIIEIGGLDIRFHGPVFKSLLFSNGGTLMDRDETAITFGGQEALEALEFMADLVNEHRVTDFGRARFNEGESVMAFVPTGTIGVLEKSQAFQWGLTMPIKKVVPGAWSGAWSFMIPRASSNQAAAWDVVKFLSSPQSMLYIAMDQGLPPTRLSVARQTEFRRANHWQVVGESLPFVSVAPHALYDGVLNQALNPAVRDSLKGLISPRGALEQAVQTATGLIAR